MITSDADIKRITHWVHLLQQKNADSVVRSFSKDLRAVMPALLLQLAWDRLAHRVGRFERICRNACQSDGIDRTVWLSCAFTGSVREVVLGVRLDPAHRILGFFGYVLPHDTPLTHRRIPSYIHLDYFTEREVLLGRAPWTVGGTLTRPVWEGPFPALLILSTQAHEGQNGAFNQWRDLAWALAGQGIMVLRYEHALGAHPNRDPYRNHPDRDGNGVAPPLTVQDDVLDNALSALAMLEANSDCNGHLFVLGHSLGGYLLPRLAYQYRRPLGLISLFGHVRPPWEVLADEVISALQPSNTELRQQLAARLQTTLQQIRQGTYRDEDRVGGMSGRYWADLRAHHGKFSIAPEAPILVISGDGRRADEHRAEFERIRFSLRGHPRATFARCPGLTAALSDSAQGDENGPPGPKQSVDPRLIHDLARWVRTTTV